LHRFIHITMASLVEHDDEVVQALLNKLRRPDTDLPAKYRVLFSLRSIAGPGAHAAMLEGEGRYVWHGG
jgi:hypothetical protein